jgi:hypothetical protein
MAAWLAPALIGSALISGVGQAVAGNATANAQKKAANQANATQWQMFREANQLNEPWRLAGINALGQQQALLGIGGGGGAGAGGYGAPAGGADWTAYLRANPDVAAAYQKAIQQPHLKNLGITSMEDFAQYHYENFGRGEGRQLPTVAGPTGADGQPLSNQQIADNAYGTFLGSGFNRAMTDFTNNDLDQLKGAFAAGGKSLSGSAVGAMGDRLARNRYTAFGDYSNALAGLSGTGAQLSTSAGQAGMNTAAQVGANNMNAANARGSSYMNTANALSGTLQNATNVAAYGVGQGWFGGGGKMPTLSNEVVNGYMVSDVRAKTDIVAIEPRSGRNWYRFRYVWDDPGTVREGVMAQEILETDPHAVGRHPTGYLMVNYGEIG